MPCTRLPTAYEPHDVFSQLASVLTDWEVFEFQSQWDTSYAYKMAALEIANNYTILCAGCPRQPIEMAAIAAMHGLPSQ